MEGPVSAPTVAANQANRARCSGIRRLHRDRRYLGRSDQFDRSIAAFSQRYTDQNELDYQALATAIRSGCLEALEGVRGAIL
jgi:hypothetical protein